MGDKIRTVIEIAMEKMAAMDDITPAEAAEQKEKEYRPRGEGLAARYLADVIRGIDLKTEMARYSDKERAIVRRACLSALMASITIEDVTRSLRAVAATTCQRRVDPSNGQTHAVSWVIAHRCPGRRRRVPRWRQETIQLSADPSRVFLRVSTLESY